MASIHSEPPSCSACGNTKCKLRTCGRCKQVQYCNVGCQRAHWKVHKKTCGPPTGGKTSNTLPESRAQEPPEAKKVVSGVPNGVNLVDQPATDVETSSSEENEFVCCCNDNDSVFQQVPGGHSLEHLEHALSCSSSMSDASTDGTGPEEDNPEDLDGENGVSLRSTQSGQPYVETKLRDLRARLESDQAHPHRAAWIKKRDEFKFLLTNVKAGITKLGTTQGNTRHEIWVSVRVEKAGFQTGELLSTLRPGVDESNFHWLSDDGMKEMLHRLLRGTYVVQYPEQAIVPCLVLLLAQGCFDEAIGLMSSIREATWNSVKLYPEFTESSQEPSDACPLLSFEESLKKIDTHIKEVDSRLEEDRWKAAIIAAAYTQKSLKKDLMEVLAGILGEKYIKGYRESVKRYEEKGVRGGANHASEFRMVWPGPRTDFYSSRAQHAKLYERIQEFVGTHRTLAGKILDPAILAFWVDSSHEFSSKQFSLNLTDPSPVDLEYTAWQTCAQLLAAPLHLTCVERDTNLALAITVFTILWLTPQRKWRGLMENSQSKQLLCLLLARVSRRPAHRDDLSSLSAEKEKKTRETEKTAAKIRFFETFKRFLALNREAFEMPYQFSGEVPLDSKTGPPAAQEESSVATAVKRSWETRLRNFQEEATPGIMEQLGDAAAGLNKTAYGIIFRLLHLPAEDHIKIESITSAEDLAGFFKKSSAAFEDYQSIRSAAAAYGTKDFLPPVQAPSTGLTHQKTIEAMSLLAYQFTRAVNRRRSIALFACTFGLQAQISCNDFPCGKFIVPNADISAGDASSPGYLYKSVLRYAGNNGQEARIRRAQRIAQLFLKNFPWSPLLNTALTAISELAGDALEREYGACRIPELAHDIAGNELQPKFTDSIMAIKGIVRFTLYGAWYNLEPALEEIKADGSDKGKSLYQIGEKYCCNHGLVLEYVSILCGYNMPLFHELLPRLDKSMQTAPTEHDFAGSAEKIWRFILGKVGQFGQSDGLQQENAVCNAWKMLLITVTLGARVSPEPSAFVADVLDRMQQEAADFLSNLARNSDRQEKEALPQISWTHFPLRGRREGKVDAPPSAGNAFCDELYSQWLAAAGESPDAPRNLKSLTETLSRPLEATARDVKKHRLVRAAAMIELLFLVPFWTAATFSQFPAHVQTAAADYEGGPVPLSRRLLRWKINGVTRDEYFTFERLGELLR